MEPVALLADKLKGFAKVSEDFVMGMLHWHENSNHRNPVEILKRLQREAFSDLMKLRDRQDKVERVLSFYKSTKGGELQQANTRVKGEVDVIGALVFLDDVDQQSFDTLDRAGMGTGIGARFTFETTTRKKDALLAEFVTNRQGHYSHDIIGSPLSLTKVMYSANVSDWFSAVVIPVGAQCKDVATASNALQQESSLNNFSSFWSPILGQHQNTGAGVGLMVKRSNISAVLAEFVSDVGMQQEQPNSMGIRRCFSTFGKIVCQLSKGTKFSLMGVHEKLTRPSQQQHIPLNKFTFPLGSLKRNKVGTTYASSSPAAATLTRNNSVEEDGSRTGGGSVAVMVESELDENTRIGGWVEMHKSSPGHLRWGITLLDTSEEEEEEEDELSVGWGLSVGGGGNIRSKGEGGGDLCSSWDHHFQVEVFLKTNMVVGGNKRFSLQPGFVYVMDRTTRIPALMFRSNWFL